MPGNESCPVFFCPERIKSPSKKRTFMRPCDAEGHGSPSDGQKGLILSHGNPRDPRRLVPQ